MKAQQMPRSELNVTHPQFLRNAMTTKQGVSSENPSLDRSNVKNPYSNIIRHEGLGDTEAGLHEEIESGDLNRMQRNQYHTSNQNFFEVNKP